MFRRRASAEAPPRSSSTSAIRANQIAAIEEALAAVPVGVLVESADGTPIVANALVASPFGELTADTLAEVAVRRALDGARRGEVTVERVDIAGTQPRSLEVTATPLAGGGAVAVAVDTTERLRLDAVRRDFVANVNHELRTPIGALTVLAEALAGEANRSTVERLAGRIQAEAARAAALIDDLLEFAKVEAREQPRHREVDIAEVVALATQRTSALAEQRRIRVVTNVEPAVVVGEFDQLVVALTNLLDNAMNYSDEGGTVNIDARTSGKNVEITVRDEGIGIPARDLDRIFERFYRVDAARDRRTGGTGLGLAIVRHVATNHGGEIFVDSQEGVGSTFVLRLPATRDA